MHNLVDLLVTLTRVEELPGTSIWHVRDAEETSVTDMLTLIAEQAAFDSYEP